MDRNLPGPGSNRGYDPSVFVDSLVLIPRKRAQVLRAGGRSLEDMRELDREEALMKLLGREEIPDPDTLGDWLRRMGDPKRGGVGLVGLDRVRNQLNERY